MKRTQIVTHIMPTEIDEYSDTIDKLTEASEYLENEDWISIYATLNLSPELINWNESELKPDFFIEKFNQIKQKCSWANEVIFEIVDDNSILGTTSQKRKAIKGDYNQFIFLDCDIAFHPTTLKYLLISSKQIEEPYYIVTPQTVKLWDYTWDIITHKSFINKSYGYEKIHPPMETYNQIIDYVSIYKLGLKDIEHENGTVFLKNILTKELIKLGNFKFACGWFTLYSKSILDLIGIPDWLGHYGPEDTNILFMSEMYNMCKWPIAQYVLDGVYISENYISRDTKYNNKLKLNNLKNEFRAKAESVFGIEVTKAKDLIFDFK